MNVQHWLRTNKGDLDLLEGELGIKSVCHEDGRVILNYNQIESPKDHPIVQECRGLVLDQCCNWELVARAFPRFFNVGELPEQFKEFGWDDCVGTHKEDGSLILIYFWRGNWRVNTRGSFADGLCNDIMSWIDLVNLALPDGFFDNASNGYTYVFELCSPYNKVVRQYQRPVMFLLSMFNNVSDMEVSDSIVRNIAIEMGVDIPNRVKFRSIEEVEGYIRIMADHDPTFEGIVLRDAKNRRWKVKSPEYLALHRMANNGDPCHPKNLLPFIISGELDELYSYFEEVKPFVEDMQEVIADAWHEIDNLWHCFHDEPSQKKFAMAVKDSKHSGILFSARKYEVEPWDLFFTLEYLTKMFKVKK